ncbi:MAG: translation initiation factor IF-2 [Clostridia bacterium]|nr:translation initiation factor IF-2 [Clostridia bacterium]
MSKNGIKINELAKIVSWESKRVMSKLNEMGIYPRSLESEITEEQAESFYRRINFTKGGKEKAAASTETKTQKKTPATGKGSGVIVRRVVVESSDDEQESSKKSSKRDSQASSGLRSGYSTVRGADDYEALINSAKKNNAEKKGDSSSAESVVPEDTAPAAPRKIIRRIKKVEPVAETAEVKPAEKAEAKAEVKAEEPVKEPAKEEKKPEPVAEPVKEEPKAETKAEEKAPENKGEASENVKNAGSIEVIEIKSKPSKPAQERQPAQNRDNRDNRESRPRDDRGGRNDRPARPERNDRGDRPGFDKNRNNGGQGGQRPQRDNRRQGGLSIPAVDPAVMQQDTRREKVQAPEKQHKKEQTRQQGGRNNNAPQKDKYKTAQRFIGDKKGVNEIESDEFSYSGAYDIDHSRKKSAKPKKKDKNAKAQPGNPPVIAVLTNIKVPPVLTVKELAEMMKKSASEVIKKLMLMGVMATLNQELDFDTAALIASEFGITAEPEIIVTDEELLFEDPDDEIEAEDAEPRPPVVVVMGHVDHGKTSLLDAIRSTSVTAGEAGGITQHIGAYMVTINGRKITFLDTPGHEAFTAMRARGAQVTDVAIIVVAADDGVMPQTVEAINHAKAANVSIVVAVNKIDREGANVDRVMTEMAENGIVPEAWGGDVPFIEVSAKQRINIEELLETVLLSADILELKASSKKQAKGTIIEAKLDKNRGPVATLLVQRGTLNIGDAILSETTFGHIRTMTNDKGQPIKSAGPSTPVEITGLTEVPEAGKVFFVVNNDERLAKKVADTRRNAQRAETMAYSNKVNLEDLFSQIQSGNVKDLNIIVKADVRGSVEAIKQSLEKLSNDEVRVCIIHGGVGGVTESDISLAEASNAIIIGFNVRPVGNVAEVAAAKGVDVKLYRVIYDAINDVKAAMSGMLEPEYKEVVMGHVEIRKTFNVSGVGTIAGGYVTNGKVVRNSEVRIVRDGIVVHEGKLASLKRFKDDVKEVASGFECGLSFERYNDIKEGDVVESFVMEAIARTVN